MDCLAVSLTLATSRRLSWPDILRMALFFGLFQGLMPLAGWLLGSSIQSQIESVDHWIAFGILAFIGLRMVRQSFLIAGEKRPVDIRRTRVLLSLSVATSIDALITGIGFGFIRVNIIEAVATITVITFLVTVTGARLGEKSRFLPARWAEFAGGLVLIAIGVKVVLDHMGLL